MCHPPLEYLPMEIFHLTIKSRAFIYVADRLTSWNHYWSYQKLCHPPIVYLPGEIFHLTIEKGASIQWIWRCLWVNFMKPTLFLPKVVVSIAYRISPQGDFHLTIKNRADGLISWNLYRSYEKLLCHPPIEYLLREIFQLTIDNRAFIHVADGIISWNH